LLVFKPNLVPRCALYSFFNVCQNVNVKRKKKKKKKNENMSNFLKAYISGMAGTIRFRSGMYSLPICQHLYSKFGLVWSRDHGDKNVRKSYLFFMSIHSRCAHMLLFLGLHDTLLCVLIISRVSTKKELQWSFFISFEAVCTIYNKKWTT